ncbi:MAG: ice-binding family protein [Cyclobacteriaceae bacterium]
MQQKSIIPVIAMLLIVLATSCKEESEVGINPSISSVAPFYTEVSGVGLVVSATFTVAMNPATITTSTFRVRQGNTPILGTVSYVGMTATFTPLARLEHHVTTTATITTGAKNIHGQALANDYVWDFTTCHPPTVISVGPADLATCVALNQPITAVFSEETDPTTVNTTTFTLKAGTTSVAGAVTFNGHTGTFTPTTSLTAATLYTATITTGVLNGMDVPLENPFIWSFTTTGPLCSQTQACGPLNVDLKTAGRFGILAGVGISNVGLSVINDLDVGISPGFRSSITGFPPAIIVNGAIYAANDIAPPGSIAVQAQLDLKEAYLFAEAATSPAPVTITGDLGGKTLVPGIYKSSSTMLIQSGDLILDGGQSPCDSTSVWIFQVGSALTTVGGGGGNIILIGGAKANRVFWQVGSSTTIGSGTSFKGNILALTSITMGSGSTVEGRVLARNGAVTLASGNTINKPQ